MSQKQRTFYVGDEKITIKSRPKLWHNNPNGYAVSINGKQYHCNFLTRQEAEDCAIIRWVKETTSAPDSMTSKKEMSLSVSAIASAKKEAGG